MQSAAEVAAGKPNIPQQESAPASPVGAAEDSSLLLRIINATNAESPELVRRLFDAEIVRDSFNQDWRLAKVFAMSGQFADIKGQTEQQAIATAMAKIQLGRSWGLTPADAIQFIYFTNGRPAVMNELIAGKIREGGYDWDPQWTESDGIVTGCTLWLKRWNAEQQKFEGWKDRNGKEISVSFTKAEASRTQIHENGKTIPLTEKWNFKSFPREMYYWRCVGRVKKFYLTNILRGAISVDEAQDLPGAETSPAADSGRRAAEDLRSKGAKVHEIRVDPESDTSTRQTATDDTGGASSPLKPETSTPAEQATVEESPGKKDAAPELTQFQQNVWQYVKSLDEKTVRNVMGVHSCEDIGQVNESNWKAIATECEEKLKNRRIQFGKGNK